MVTWGCEVKVKHTRQEAAKILGVSTRTILRMIEDGRLNFSKNIHNQWEIKDSDLSKFMGKWVDESEQLETRMKGYESQAIKLNEAVKQIQAILSSISEDKP